jgi:gluconate 2-dehydrogenase gamma chain
MSEMSRREALLVLGAIPVAAALHTTPAAAARAIAVARGAAARPGTYEPTFFTPHEWHTVRLLVDLIIPADDHSGSATDAGVPEFMDFTMTDRPALQTQMRGGLRWLDAESRRRFEAVFVELGDGQRAAILDDIAFPGRAPAALGHGVAFFTFFRDMTASGFFSSAVGVDDLEYTGNRPVNWRGCPDDVLRNLGVSYDIMERRPAGGS